MEKCTQISVEGAVMAIKCANIIVKALPAVIDLTSVTCPSECFVGDTVTVTVTCTNTSVTAGVANLTFSDYRNRDTNTGFKSTGGSRKQCCDNHVHLYPNSPKHYTGWLCKPRERYLNTLFYGAHIVCRN